MDKAAQDADRVGRFIQELVAKGVVAGLNGVERPIFPFALEPLAAAALRDWVVRERAVQTVEVGLAFGFSTLHICQALLQSGRADVRNVAMDPNQLTGYASAGLRVLESAGVDRLVEFYPEESQLRLPRLVQENRSFDLGFIDGNHRFDYVFVDLFFLRRLIRTGGVIILDDYGLPGIRRAASFYVENLRWTVEEVVDGRMVVLRTPVTPDTRDFTFFAEF